MLKDKSGTKKGVKYWVEYNKEEIYIFTQKGNQQFRVVYNCEHPIVDKKYDKRDIEALKTKLDEEIEITAK